MMATNSQKKLCLFITTSRVETAICDASPESLQIYID